MDRLNEKDANRYVIYQAILDRLPYSKSLDDLKEKLAKKNIETLYKYKGQTKELQGISFKIGNFKYKGSEIDRKFSVKNLQNAIDRQELNISIKPLATSNSNSIAKENIIPEFKKSRDNNTNILLPVDKQQENTEPLPYQWKLGKRRRKKKSNRLNL